MPSRRAVLLGGLGGLTAVAATGAAMLDGVLPGRTRLRRAFGLNGEAGVVPDVGPATTVFGEFTSAARGDVATGYAIITPALGTDVDPWTLPVVVALHQHGGSHRSVADGMLAMDRFLQAHVDGGGDPFVVVAADGGDDYWHRRRDGTDPAAMITDELLPMLTERGLRAAPHEPIGLLGWSMGGYGVLRLAGVLGPDRVRAAVAVSPALWLDPDDASADGFVDAAEYDEFTVFGHQSDLAGIALRVDCGTGDVFEDAVRAYVEPLPAVQANFEPGGHDPAYWHRVLPGELEFLGAALSAK